MAHFTYKFPTHSVEKNKSTRRVHTVRSPRRCRLVPWSLREMKIK